jgi:hypothetical protein
MSGMAQQYAIRAHPLLFSRREDLMAEEREVTQKIERKNDVFGNPKEEKTTTTEKREDKGLFGSKEKTTTVERKEEE